MFIVEDDQHSGTGHSKGAAGIRMCSSDGLREGELVTWARRSCSGTSCGFLSTRLLEVLQKFSWDDKQLKLAEDTLSETETQFLYLPEGILSATFEGQMYWLVGIFANRVHENKAKRYDPIVILLEDARSVDSWFV